MVCDPPACGSPRLRLGRPPVPSAGNLSLDPNWWQENARRLQLAAEFHAGNDELLGLLHENLQHVEFNRYTLEVFLSIARLCRQNIEMLEDLNRVYASFETAETSCSPSKTWTGVGRETSLR